MFFEHLSSKYFDRGFNCKTYKVEGCKRNYNKVVYIYKQLTKFNRLEIVSKSERSEIGEVRV